MAYPAPQIDVGVEDAGEEVTLWWGLRIILAHVEVEDECAGGVGGFAGAEEDDLPEPHVGF